MIFSHLNSLPEFETDYRLALIAEYKLTSAVAKAKFSGIDPAGKPSNDDNAAPIPGANESAAPLYAVVFNETCR